MKTNKLVLIAFGIALNIVGGFVAVQFKLPIYLDSIGTLFIACLFGSKYGIITGMLGSITSGILFDIYSLYFSPVQIATGFFGGYAYKKGLLRGKKQPLGVFLCAVPTALLSAIIASYLFGGVTSAGSSYIVQILRAMGFPDVASVFVIQVFTDYADKYLAVLFALSAIPIYKRISKVN
ncbi:MAG: ECF transporter S component [Epulopiscium sp. Nele67-Bin005]|nr:MAG: ECF transporter S component [Epulopiscium sp. Nele67-Bin005]